MQLSSIPLQVSVAPGAAPVFPISKTPPRFNDPHAFNHFTSACSAIVYRDDLFGPAFSGNVFVCEPVHNLVSRLVLTPDGVSFVGTAWSEPSLIRFAYSYEQATRHRVPPKTTPALSK